MNICSTVNILHLQGGTCPFGFKIKMMLLELRDKKVESTRTVRELIRETTERDLLIFTGIISVVLMSLQCKTLSE